MNDLRFNIHMVHNADRMCQSCVMSTDPVTEDTIQAFVKGHHDVLNMFIAEHALFFFLVDSFDSNVGKVSDRVALVHPNQLFPPFDTFMVNMPFMNLIEGDNLFEQLGKIAPILDVDGTEYIRQLFTEYNIENIMHCVAVEKNVS